MRTILILLTSLFLTGPRAQFVATVPATAAAGGGAPSLSASCFVNNFQPASGVSTCTASVTSGQIAVVYSYTDATAFTTPISAPCVSGAWSTTTNTAVHQMATSIGTITSTTSCVFTMTASTVSNNNALAVLICSGCTTTVDGTLGFKSSGFSTSVTTSTVTTTVNNDFISACNFELSSTTTFSAISWSDGTALSPATPPLDGVMPGTNGTAGLCFVGIQSTHGAIHGLWTENASANGTPVFVSAIE